MRIVKCRVADEYVVGDNVVVGAAGSHNDVALMLEFSPMWDGTTKQIVWHDALGENPIITILTVDMVFGAETNTYVVPIPAEPKAKAGEMTMTIKGTIVNGDKEQSATMSATAKFRILPSSWDSEAEQTQDITPSQAAQLQQQLDKVLETIVDIDGAVDAAQTAAQQAAEAAQAAAENALPAVSAADNGKALRVVNGKWAADSAPSGAQTELYWGEYTDL